MINEDHNPAKLANFRELGGIPVNSGSVAQGKLFRSDDLATIDNAEAQFVAEKGISLIIDLRAESEVAETGRGELAKFPIEYVNLPLMSDEAAPHKLFENMGPDGITAEQMGSWYFDLFLTSTPIIISALERIAVAEAPVVFHCVAGKDRTGLIAFSLLSLLGTSVEDIIRDYALTQQVMPNVLKRIHSRDSKFSREDMVKAGSMLRADAEAAEIFFALLDNEGIVIEQFLKQKGLKDSTHELLVSKYVSATVAN